MPVTLASSRALEALGSVYLWLELDADNEGDRLGFEAAWESPVSFQWTLIKVGADGRDLGRLELPYEERETAVRDQLLGFDEARGVLIVGTNLGGVDLAHPFDPDYQPWEPHALTVYLTEL